MAGHVIAQVAIAVFNAARGVSTPYLLWDRFRKQTQLPLAFLDLQVGLLQLQSAFLYLGLQLIPRARIAISARFRATHHSNGDSAYDNAVRKLCESLVNDIE